MRSLRLLPVVIAAAAALLLLKGIGIVSTGGYVLSGPVAVQAAGGGGHESADPGNVGLTLPADRLMTDTSPTLADSAPTLPLGKPGAPHADSPHAVDAHGVTGDAAGGIAEAEGTPCPPEGVVPGAHGDDGLPGFDFTKVTVDCAAAGVTASGDSLPTQRDGSGNIVPLAEATGSEQAVVERLGDRREALAERESELDMRMALVEAAEKRLAERTAALEALQARVEALVEEKKARDDTQFVAIVAMYETMKPKDAAAIFDRLELPVLLRVAAAITPRRMAPILAQMDPQKARDLTTSMAVETPEPSLTLAAEDLSALPQIVGQ